MSPQDAAIDAAIALFPDRFGLLAFPGETFRIVRSACYYSDENGPMLYTYVLRDGDWVSFAKGTVEELQREFKELKKS